MPRISPADQAEAWIQLRKRLAPGTTVYSVIRHVARSGMSRDIDFYVIDPAAHDGPRLQYLTGWIANALELPLASRDGSKRGLKRHGCGMDMAFDTVYSLSSRLFKGQEKRVGKDAGYALKSEVL